MLLLLVGGLGFTEATGVTNVRGTVIRLFSPEGTLVVEVDDPEVSVKIDGSDLVITGAGAKEIRLKPGSYTVEASKDGKVVSRELVTVTKNGRQVVRVSQEVRPQAPAPAEVRPQAPALAAAWAPTPEQQTWLDTVAKLPLPQRLESIQRKLVEENKSRVGVDNEDQSVIMALEPKDGLPTKCTVSSNSYGLAPHAIWPLLALPSLTSLDLTDTAVTDFAPLVRLPLTELDANLIVDNVKSEAALQSMTTLKKVNGRPAAEYWAERTAIRQDIDDMAGNLPKLSFEDRLAWFKPVITKLNPKCAGELKTTLGKDAQGLTALYVGLAMLGADISPVRALGVEAFVLQSSTVSDLSPLAKSKIQVLKLVGNPHLRDLTPLAGLPLKELRLGESLFADIRPLAGVKLESIHFEPWARLDYTALQGMPLTSLTLPVTAPDVRPLKGMKLKYLSFCGGSDISPLAGMPLESLWIAPVQTIRRLPA